MNQGIMASLVRPDVDREYAEVVMSQALETAEGRHVLSQVMVEPIKVALDYQGVGRKLLAVDELPQGALPRYERDVSVKSYVISKRGTVPDMVIEGEELFIPTYILATNPTIRVDEIRQRRYYIVDRAQVRAKDSLMRQEDLQVFKVLSAAVDTNHTIAVSGNLTPDQINLALAMIEENELIGAKIVVHPQSYRDIRGWGKAFFDEATQRDVLMSGLFGHVWSADIHCSTMVPRNCVFVTAPGEFVGAIPVRQDLTVMPADDPKELRLGWVMFMIAGYGIINSYGISRILLYRD